MDYSDLSITIMPEACSRAMTLAMLRKSQPGEALHQVALFLRLGTGPCKLHCPVGLVNLQAQALQVARSDHAGPAFASPAVEQKCLACPEFPGDSVSSWFC